MLCATVLAELERADPVERRVAPISNSIDSSSVTSDQAPIGSPLSPTSLSDLIERGQACAVGKTRDFSGHAEGTTAAYNSVKKWVDAALCKLRFLDQTFGCDTSFFSYIDYFRKHSIATTLKEHVQGMSAT